MCLTSGIDYCAGLLKKYVETNTTIFKKLRAVKNPLTTFRDGLVKPTLPITDIKIMLELSELR
ncbi:MAG: hypothetical protein KGL58_04310, partial [Pseudomonadota bacterium]|nr:hypothetical protein [Pseudomonadota bacterium]